MAGGIIRMEPSEVFYVISNKTFMDMNVYKIGGLDNQMLLKTHIETISPMYDPYFPIALYQTFNYKLIIEFINNYLKPFRIFKNSFKININDFLKILDDYMNEEREYNHYFISIRQSLKENIGTKSDVKPSTGYRNYIGNEWIPFA